MSRLFLFALLLAVVGAYRPWDCNDINYPFQPRYDLVSLNVTVFDFKLFRSETILNQIKTIYRTDEIVESAENHEYRLSICNPVGYFPDSTPINYCTVVHRSPINYRLLYAEEDLDAIRRDCLNCLICLNVEYGLFTISAYREKQRWSLFS